MRRFSIYLFEKILGSKISITMNKKAFEIDTFQQ